MTITITAFERSPDGGKGLARDTRVRWANFKPPGSWRATSPGMRSACLWSRIASAIGWSNFPFA
jgi:hypothetical protein